MRDLFSVCFNKGGNYELNLSLNRENLKTIIKLGQEWLDEQDRKEVL